MEDRQKMLWKGFQRPKRLEIEAELVSEKRLVDLMQEGNEILAMTVFSIKTLRKRRRKQPNPKSSPPSYFRKDREVV